MDENERVIFAVLRRDCFDAIVAALEGRFGTLRHGSQGDDWIWVERGGVRIDVDSFYSMQLELKGPRRAWGLAQEILSLLAPDSITAVHQPPL